MWELSVERVVLAIANIYDGSVTRIIHGFLLPAKVRRLLVPFR